MDDATPDLRPDVNEGLLPEIASLAIVPYRLFRPLGRATPVICASPHSGRLYPPEMMAASQLDRRAIRRSEDALVDELIAAAPDQGHTLIAAELARAFLDVNRDPWELDPAMFEDELPAFAKAR